LSALIPGLIIQFITFCLYQGFFDNQIKISEIVTLYKEIVNEGIELGKNSKYFLAKYHIFMIYCFCLYFVAWISGFLLSRVIRFFHLDRKIKILRYKNPWYYLFSGEVFHFKKFKKAVNVLDRPDLSLEKVQMTLADILVKSGGKNELYSGIVIDYELDSKDPSKLESIYLFDAHRYKVNELIEGNANEKNPVSIERKAIPGSVFMLSTKEMINMNISYVVEKLDNAIEEVNKRKKVRNREFFTLSILLIFLSFIFYIFYEGTWIPSSIYHKFMKTAKWYDKVFLLFCYLQFMQVFIPVKSDDGFLSFKKDLITKIIILSISSSLFVLVQYIF